MRKAVRLTDCATFHQTFPAQNSFEHATAGSASLLPVPPADGQRGFVESAWGQEEIITSYTRQINKS